MPGGMIEQGIVETDSGGNIIDTWTESATNWTITPGSVVTNTDHYVGTYSIELTTNPGTSLIKLKFPVAQDTTGTDRIAFFTKLLSGTVFWIPYIRCYSAPLVWFGIDFPSISQTGSFVVNEFLKSAFVNNLGSPSWSNIAWVEMQIAGNAVLLFDGLGFYNGSPTLSNIKTGTPIIGNLGSIEIDP